jgi:hypothetical protein
MFWLTITSEKIWNTIVTQVDFLLVDSLQEVGIEEKWS